jgi:crotonobetainyl-CoA:carnitine CoA-transferase CaiB-like acyl-CoA transferase
MPSLGLDFPTLREFNPALVMVSISNFGQTGPYRDYKATDMVEYALGGLMYIFGSYDREPLKHAFNQAQFKAGTNAASAALMALYHQRSTGQGQHVDVSIQESVASALRDVTSNFTYTGAVRRRQPNHSGDLTRLRAVSDGFILPNPGIAARVNWNTVVEFLEAPELDDDKFRTPTARLENAEELGEILDRLFLSKNKMDMFYGAHQKRFIYGVIDSLEEAMVSPQNLDRERFVEVDHPVAGTFRYPGAPFRLSRTPWDGLHPAPTLGQHTQEVFSQRLGYTAADLEELSGMGVI